MNPDIFQQFELKKKAPVDEGPDNAANARLTIIEPLNDFNLVEGSQVVFTCLIDAHPKPEVICLSNLAFCKLFHSFYFILL